MPVFLLLILAGASGCMPKAPHASVTMETPEAAPTIRSTEISEDLTTPSVLPAFPGAEGFGAAAVGGRGGTVIEVTNLEDSGPGSLRAALEASGPRMVVFRVSGTVELHSGLVIEQPFVTVAGQTAPGGGITLRGVEPGIEALIQIATHDVIVRFLTLRAGPPSAGDAVLILASGNHDTYNVVIDHNSMSWAVNRNLATWYDVHGLSIQWNIFSEGLNCSIHPKGCHSKGVLLGGYASDERKNQPGAHDISFHHNLLAHNGERNPYIEASGIIDIVNNVVYNPFGTFSHIDMTEQLKPDLVNYVGNLYKPGPNTEVKYGIRTLNAGTPGTGIFVRGNIGPKRESDKKPEIEIVDPDSRQFVVSNPFPSATIITTSAVEAYEQVLAESGAGQGLNCDGTFFFRRDAIDARIVQDVRIGTGRIIDDPSEVGGWLDIPPAAACDDIDHDGMPDVWEDLFALDKEDAHDGTWDANGNGYSNLEEFLNGTNPKR